MDRESAKRYREIVRGFIEDGSIVATDEQIKFLLDLYSDGDCTVGIHNTIISSDTILKNGLHNYNSRGDETDDLSNTVMYSNTLFALAMYPNGDGKEREDTAIILKIPNKVFSHEQGIFETLPDGKFGIPTQFIAGAFFDGKVIVNPAYQKEYNNPDALKCVDSINVDDRKKQIKLFKKEYNKGKSKVGARLKSFVDRIKNKSNKKALPPAGEQENLENINGEKTLVDLYREQLQAGIDANALLNIKPSIPEVSKQKTYDDVDRDDSNEI